MLHPVLQGHTLDRAFLYGEQVLSRIEFSHMSIFFLSRKTTKGPETPERPPQPTENQDDTQ